MKFQKFKYQELVDLGFIRENTSDSVYTEQTGNQPFFLSLKLKKNITLEWDSTADSDTYGMVRMYRKVAQSDYRIIIIRDMTQIMELIEFYRK